MTSLFQKIFDISWCSAADEPLTGVPLHHTTRHTDTPAWSLVRFDEQVQASARLGYLRVDDWLHDGGDEGFRPVGKLNAFYAVIEVVAADTPAEHEAETITTGGGFHVRVACPRRVVRGGRGATIDHDRTFAIRPHPTSLARHHLGEIDALAFAVCALAACVRAVARCATTRATQPGWCSTFFAGHTLNSTKRYELKQ